MSIPQQTQQGKWGTKKVKAAAVASLMYAAGMERRAGQVASCSDRLEWAWCPECGKMHISRAWLCRDRLCPVCSWRLSLRRGGQLSAVVGQIVQERPETRLALLTLTLASVPAVELEQTIRHMLKSWARISKRTAILEAVEGWARSLEITSHDGMYHPHLHVILVYKPQGYIDQAKWVKMWKESARLKYTPVCDIRAVSAEKDPSADRSLMGAIAEVCKYVSKSEEILHIPPTELPYYAAAIADVRLCGYGGIIADLRKKLKQTDSLPNVVSDQTLSCPDCGWDGRLRVVYEWATSDMRYRLVSALPEENEDAAEITAYEP